MCIDELLLPLIWCASYNKAPPFSGKRIMWNDDDEHIKVINQTLSNTIFVWLWFTFDSIIHCGFSHSHFPYIKMVKDFASLENRTILLLSARIRAGKKKNIELKYSNEIGFIFWRFFLHQPKNHSLWCCYSGTYAFACLWCQLVRIEHVKCGRACWRAKEMDKNGNMNLAFGF